MAKKKRRRLKKPVKRALIVMASSLQLATITCASNAVMIKLGLIKAKAEVSTNETIKTIAKLQNADLSNKTVLKNYVVSEYASKNKTELDTDDTTVLISSPTVVTNPTINNVEFTVITKEEKEEAISQNIETIQNTPEPVQEKEDASTKENEISETTNETETKLDSENVKQDDDEKEAVSEETENKTVVENKIENETKESSEAELASDGENKKEVESLKLLGETLDTDPNKSLNIKSTEDTADLDLESANESIENGLAITLKTNSVTISDGSAFVPENYVEKISGKNNTLPTLMIDNPVDSYTSGTYTVTYKIIDLDGSTLSTELTVTIENSDELTKLRKELSAKAIQQYVDATNGKHIDEDGYYGDQCWDLWGNFNRVMELTDFDDGCSPYGYVYGIPLKYKKSGASKYYTYINAGEQLEAGDWLFWNKGSSYSDSHVALLLGINEDGTLKCLTQSYGQGTRILDLQPDIMAAFRLKSAYGWWTTSK